MLDLSLDPHFENPPSAIRFGNWGGFWVLAVVSFLIVWAAGCFHPFGDGAEEITVSHMSWLDDDRLLGLAPLTAAEKRDNKLVIQYVISLYESGLNGGQRVSRNEADKLARVLSACHAARWYQTYLRHGCSVVAAYFDGDIPLNVSMFKARLFFGYEPESFNYAIASLSEEHFREEGIFPPIDEVMAIAGEPGAISTRLGIYLRQQSSDDLNLFQTMRRNLFEDVISETYEKHHVSNRVRDSHFRGVPFESFSFE